MTADLIDFLMHCQPELVPILPTIEDNVDSITLRNRLIRIGGRGQASTLAALQDMEASLPGSVDSLLLCGGTSPTAILHRRHP